MSFNWDLRVFDTLSSTQDECKNLAREGAEEGCVVQAIEQKDGYGRHGRAWDSGQGNLTMSCILKPDIEARYLGHFSIIAGVALARAIGDQAVLKWPNDVLIDGLKCAGILIDSDLDGTSVNWIVIGVGVNTQSSPQDASVLNVERDGFRDLFLKELQEVYMLYKSQGFEPIRQAWLNKTFPRGTCLNIGLFEDLDKDGNLIVRDAQNTLKPYSSGDVYLKDTHYAAGH